MPRNRAVLQYPVAQGLADAVPDVVEGVPDSRRPSCVGADEQLPAVPSDEDHRRYLDYEVAQACMTMAVPDRPTAGRVRNGSEGAGLGPNAHDAAVRARGFESGGVRSRSGRGTSGRASAHTGCDEQGNETDCRDSRREPHALHIGTGNGVPEPCCREPEQDGLVVGPDDSLDPSGRSLHADAVRRPWRPPSPRPEPRQKYATSGCASRRYVQ
jgi:hypothetical protein